MYKHRVKRMGGGGAAIRIFYNLSLRTSHYLSPEGGLGGRFFFGGGGSHSFEGEGSPTEFKEHRTFTANQLPMRGRVIISDRAFGEAGIRSILSGHNQNLQPLPFPGGK